jgi:predicted transcriptional regulator
LNIFENIFMPTTVHIPDALLEALDRRAKELGTSRNRLIVEAVERSLRHGSEWPAGFIERLKAADPDQAAAVDEMLAHILKNRRSKGPPSL